MPEAKKNKIKIIIYSSVIIAFIFLFYLTLADKAQKVKAFELGTQYKENKISKEQYEKLRKENTLIKILTDPKYIFEVD